MDTNEHECYGASAAADHVVFAGVVSAKAATSIVPGATPRIIEIRKPPALKARFTAGRAQMTPTGARPVPSCRSVSSVVRLFASLSVHSWLNLLLGSGETDLDRRVWLLRIHDHRLGRLHFHELVFNLFHGL